MIRRFSVGSTVALAAILGIGGCTLLLAQEPAAGRAGARPAPDAGRSCHEGGVQGGRGGQDRTTAICSGERRRSKSRAQAVRRRQGRVDERRKPGAVHSVQRVDGHDGGPFALTFRDKTNLLDLSGGAKIRWATKTSGFHSVRPVIKLADGSMFVGDVSSENVAMMAVSEFPVATVRWVKLDPMRVVTLGSPGPFNQIWVTPDLSKVDEVGFADLIPGSGHGTGGWVHVGCKSRCTGKTVPRGPN